MTDSYPYQWSYHLSPPGPPETILFLHGFMGCKEDWEEVTELLRDKYRTLTVDLPGHGATPPIADDHAYRMENCVRGLIDLLDSLTIERCHLVGYSMGGRLALYLLLHYPDRFIRGILESSSPGLATEAERQERRARDEQLAEELEQCSIESFVAKWYAQPIFQSLKESPRLTAMKQRRMNNRTGELARSLRQMGAGTQPAMWEQLAQAKRSILFMAGLFDSKFTALARQMQALCPGSHVAVIKDAGHIIHLDQCYMYTHVARVFLQPNRERIYDDRTVA